MHFALSRQDRVDNLIVVDKSPSIMPIGPAFEGYIQAMKSINAARVTTASQADKILLESVKVSTLTKN